MSGTAGGDLQSVIELFAGLLDFLLYGDQNYFIIRCNRALLDQVFAGTLDAQFLW